MHSTEYTQLIACQLYSFENEMVATPNDMAALLALIWDDVFGGICTVVDLFDIVKAIHSTGIDKTCHEMNWEELLLVWLPRSKILYLVHRAQRQISTHWAMTSIKLIAVQEIEFLSAIGRNFFGAKIFIWMRHIIHAPKSSGTLLSSFELIHLWTRCMPCKCIRCGRNFSSSLFAHRLPRP